MTLGSLHPLKKTQQIYISDGESLHVKTKSQQKGISDGGSLHV
jgi:hypothetical protein